MPEPSDFCQNIQPELAAYALGERTLDPVAQAHLAECPYCQKTLHAYAEVAQALPFDVPEVAPPPRLREHILAAAAPEKPAGLRPLRTRYGLWPALAAALATIIALLGWNLQLRNQIETQSTQLAFSRESWQTMVVLLNDPAIQRYTVTGDHSRGQFWVPPGSQIACLVASDLPELAPNQVFQVWLVHGAERVSGGTFEARNGNGWVLVRANTPLDGYETLGVTIEPRGGSSSPGGPLILGSSLRNASMPTDLERQTILHLLADARRG